DCSFDNEFVMVVVHDLPAAGFGARDGGSKQVTRHTLNDVFDEQSVPCALRCPFPFFIVEKFDVERGVRELLIRDQARAGIVDDAAARQFERQRVTVEIGGDRRQGRRVYLDSALAMDRGAGGGPQPAPERARWWVLCTASLSDRQYFGGGAAVVANDFLPRSDGSAEAKCEFGTLAELTIAGTDVCDRGVLLQDKMREDAV